MHFFDLYCTEKCIFVENFSGQHFTNYVPIRLKTRFFSIWKKMFIKDETITLRVAEPDDAGLIYEWENDRSVWRVSGTHVPYSRFQIEQFLLGNNDLESQKQLRLIIDLNETKESIGCIDIFDFDAFNSRAAVGILIDKAFRRQGLAKSALALCIEYLFEDLMLHQVYCSVDETNLESQRLFLSQGFEPCGRRKDWIKASENFIDELEYQLIKRD